MLDSGRWTLHFGSQALGTRCCCRLVENKIRTQFLILLILQRVQILTWLFLEIIFRSYDTKEYRKKYCEKLNYITSSYLFSGSHPKPSISKISPENTSCQFLLLVKLQINGSQQQQCRLLTAKPCSAQGASPQPAFMGSCLTICQTCLPCPPSGQTRLNIGASLRGREKCLVQ